MLYACAQSSLLFVRLFSVKEDQYLICNVWHKKWCQMKLMLIDGSVCTLPSRNYGQTARQKGTIKSLFKALTWQCVRVCVCASLCLRALTDVWSLLSGGHCRHTHRWSPETFSLVYCWRGSFSYSRHPSPQKHNEGGGAGGCWQSHRSRKEDKEEE